MKKDFTTLLVGVIFLCTGIFVGGTMLGIFNYTINFSGWWTLFIIVPALIAIAQGGFNIGNLVLLAVGVLLFLDAQSILPAFFSWKLIVPLILIGIGLQILLGDVFKSNKKHKHQHKHHDFSNSTFNASTANSSTGFSEHHGKERPQARAFSAENSSSGSYKTASVLFGGQDIVYGNEEFSGASLTAVFGGLSVNLRNVDLLDETTIQISAIFGGIDLFLPDNVRLITNVTPILGGTEIKYQSSKDPLAKTIYINGLASFGGVSIK